VNLATLAVTLGAFAFGFVVAPHAARAIEATPPDPLDDPQPIRRVGPWLSRRRMLGPLLGLVGAAVAARTGAHPAVAAHVVAAVGLVVLSIIDLDLFLLPKRLVYPLLLATGLLLVVAAITDGNGSSLRQALLGSAGAWGALLVLHLISPGGMGFGDVRLALVIGLDLGWMGTPEVVLGLFAGFIFAAIIGIALLVTRKRGRSDAVPFGPFMAAGTLFVLIGGDVVVGLTRH